MHDITPQAADVLADLYEADGQPVTDSLKVAARFKKAHASVLRSIRAIKADQPDFYLANFAEVIDHYPNGKGGIQRRTIVRMSKDGFVFLSMGFTGKEAADWKIGYINAFNSLAAALHTPSITREVHDRVMAFERKDKITFAMASLGARHMIERKEALRDLREEKALLEDITQLRLMLGQ